MEDFNRLKDIPQSFHRNQGLFGDFVERNNIMNVFGHLMTSERGKTFVDRSKEFSQSSIDNTQKSKTLEKTRNYSNGDILKKSLKENSLESISSLLTKKPMDSQISRSYINFLLFL